MVRQRCRKAGRCVLECQILLWIQENLRSDLWNDLWIGVTSLADHGWFWVLLCTCLLLPARTRKIGLCGLLALALNYLCVNVCLKPLLARPRPFQQCAQLLPLIPAPRDFSFPSGHTACSFAAASACFFCFRERENWPAAVLPLVLAALIGCSRLYVGVHYPTDVLAGCVLGCAAGAVSYGIVSGKIWRKRRDAGN